MLDVRVQPIDVTSIVTLLGDLSPEARSTALADFANDKLAEAEATDAAILGSVPGHTTFVDGQRDAPVESVKPDGVIVFDFDVLGDTLMWIEAQLALHSPVKTGRYKKSHRLYSEFGGEIGIADVPADTTEIVFAPIVPYARRIERGWSKQAPDGVYQVVAELARHRFGNSIQVEFGYREIAGLEESNIEKRARPNSPRDMRQPAIIISLR